MIVVKVEIWPFGEEREAREIGRMRIANDGCGRLGIGNYDFKIDSPSSKSVFDHVRDHQRSRGVWVLLHACLDKVKERL